MPSETKNDTILSLQGVAKIYGNGTVANRNIDIDFKRGEIHSIVGENGAGKSTLMKIIFGIEKASSGTILYKGKPVRFNSSMEAIQAGIGMVHQHFMLIPTLTVADSIILGMEPRKGGVFLDKKAAMQQTRDIIEKYHFSLDVEKKISELSVGEKQKVEIIKTLYRNAEVMILDEPTSVLTPQETEQLFQELLEFKRNGHTIIFISHKLAEVKQISDQITVIRNGESKGTYPAAGVSIQKLTELIIGRELFTSYDTIKKTVSDSHPVLQVRNASKRRESTDILRQISFSVDSGEIVGVAGVQGNGQSELAKSIVGLMGLDGGSVSIRGTDLTRQGVKQRRASGLAYIPEDRMQDGAALDMSISENMISSDTGNPAYCKGGFLLKKSIQEYTKKLIDLFAVKTDSERVKIGSLSGGNIQKVVVAREYASHPACLIAEQPTHGIDIGSTELIHRKLIEMRNNGAAILLISADLDEILSLSDRIIVMFDGAIAGYFPSLQEVTREELGYYMLGLRRHTPEVIGGAIHE